MVVDIKEYYEKWRRHVHHLSDYTRRLPRTVSSYRHRGKRDLGWSQMRWFEQFVLSQIGFNGSKPFRKFFWLQSMCNTMMLYWYQDKVYACYWNNTCLIWHVCPCIILSVSPLWIQRRCLWTYFHLLFWCWYLLINLKYNQKIINPMG
jgi:hypothetical protein